MVRIYYSVWEHETCSKSLRKATKMNQSWRVLSDQYLVSASSSGDKLVVSSLKSTPVPVVELADGVSAQLLISFSWINNVFLSSLQYVHILVAGDVKATIICKSVNIAAAGRHTFCLKKVMICSPYSFFIWWCRRHCAVVLELCGTKTWEAPVVSFMTCLYSFLLFVCEGDLLC